MHKAWWKEGIIYQIYPQSFCDTNGDGIGDIQGIIRRLDYVKSLGVDIIWLNPVYRSPLDDNGYDISDYYNIHPMYGTMEDFDQLLAEIHVRGMRLLMDVVVNHTSDEHPWFVESRKSKDNPYRDFYFWKDGKNGDPPTNWQSFFGGSTWEYDETTGQYYLHFFTRKQPDLNWENPKVRQEVSKILKFWLEKGIDGFRMDVISLISKRLEFADTDPSDIAGAINHVYANGPRIHEYLQEQYRNALEDYDIMTVGEGPGITKEIANDYVGSDRNELSMIFHLEHMFMDWGPDGKFDFRKHRLQEFKRLFREWDEAIGERGWVSIFLDNHDFPRMVSRFGNDQEFRVESAKLLALLILTMRGTPCIYFGSEIGMTNVAFDSIEDYRDVETLNYYHEAKSQGLPDDEILPQIYIQGRDNVRTPMHWDATENGGFSEGTPWIKMNPNYRSINVAAEKNNPSGILQFYQALIAFRKSQPTFVYGKFEDLDPGHDQLFTYQRTDDEATFIVQLNMSDTTAECSIPHDGKIVMSNYADRKIQDILRPWEGRIIQM